MIGKRIKLLRENAELTQLQFSKAMNISNSALSQYKNGNRTPSDELKIKIAKYFDVSIDFLLGNTNNPRTTEAILKDAGLKRDPELGLTKDQLPKELKDLGVEYIQLAKEMQDEELDPEDVKKLIEIIKKHKK